MRKLCAGRRQLNYLEPHVCDIQSNPPAIIVEIRVKKEK